MSTLYTEIVGHSNDCDIAEQLHQLEHTGAVEYIHVSALDLSRRRLRTETNRGRECSIALPRSVALEHGSVLEISPTRAVVVRLESLPWLCLRPRDAEAALQLGFLAGHHHWRVRMEGELLFVALDQPAATYLARVQHLIDDERVTVTDD